MAPPIRLSRLGCSRRSRGAGRVESKPMVSHELRKMGRAVIGPGAGGFMGWISCPSWRGGPGMPGPSLCTLATGVGFLACRCSWINPQERVNQRGPGMPGPYKRRDGMASLQAPQRKFGTGTTVVVSAHPAGRSPSPRRGWAPWPKSRPGASPGPGAPRDRGRWRRANPGSRYRSKPRGCWFPRRRD